jgi:hypothetical protein
MARTKRPSPPRRLGALKSSPASPKIDVLAYMSIGERLRLSPCLLEHPPWKPWHAGLAGDVKIPTGAATTRCITGKPDLAASFSTNTTSCSMPGSTVLIWISSDTMSPTSMRGETRPRRCGGSSWRRSALTRGAVTRFLHLPAERGRLGNIDPCLPVQRGWAGAGGYLLRLRGRRRRHTAGVTADLEAALDVSG